MESSAAIFISAILNLVSAQAAVGNDEEVSYTRSPFDTDTNVKLGALDQLNSKFWNQNLGYSSMIHPQIQRAGMAYHRVGNGIKHYRHLVKNPALRLGSSNRRYGLSHQFANNDPNLKINGLDQFNPKVWKEQHFVHKSEHFDNYPKIEIEQASDIKQHGKDSKYESSLEIETNGENKNGIYDEHSPDDIDSKYFKYQQRINLSKAHTRPTLVETNIPEQSHQNRRQMGIENIGFKNNPLTHHKENGVRHISRTFHVRRSKLSRRLTRTGHINPHYSGAPEENYTLIDVSESSKPPENVQHNIQQYSIANEKDEEPKDNVLDVVDPDDEEDNLLTVQDTKLPVYENFNTEESKDRLKTILKVFKKNEKIKAQYNQTVHDLIDKNERIVTDFIIKHFTPKYIKQIITYASIDEENEKAHMALVNYKVVTHALLDFIHYSNPLLGYIQNLKIIAKNKLPGSEISTSTMEENVTVDELKKLSDAKDDSDDIESTKFLLLSEQSVRSNNDTEETKPLYEIAEDVDINKNINYPVTDSQETLVYNPQTYENKKQVSEDVDINNSIGYPEIDEQETFGLMLNGYENDNQNSENTVINNNSGYSVIDDQEKIVHKSDKYENNKQNSENVDLYNNIGYPEIDDQETFDDKRDKYDKQKSENVDIKKNIGYPENNDQEELINKPDEYENYKKDSEDVDINKNIVYPVAHNVIDDQETLIQEPEEYENDKKIPKDENAKCNANIVSGDIQTSAEKGNCNTNVEVPSDGQVIANESFEKEIVEATEVPTETYKDRKIENSKRKDLQQFIRNLGIPKKIEDAFCEKLTTVQAINVMESILSSFIEDLSHKYNNDTIFELAEYSVNRNLNARMDNQDCYNY